MLPKVRKNSLLFSKDYNYDKQKRLYSLEALYITYMEALKSNNTNDA